MYIYKKDGIFTSLIFVGKHYKWKLDQWEDLYQWKTRYAYKENIMCVCLQLHFMIVESILVCSQYIVCMKQKHIQCHKYANFSGY